jgi:DNA-damage-inducible protein J
MSDYVRARIDKETKRRATEALDAIGLSVSDAIRMLMIRLAEEQRLPFEVVAPRRAASKDAKREGQA